jgi:hypothetical protein
MNGCPLYLHDTDGLRMDLVQHSKWFTSSFTVKDPNFSVLGIANGNGLNHVRTCNDLLMVGFDWKYLIMLS